MDRDNATTVVSESVEVAGALVTVHKIFTYVSASVYLLSFLGNSLTITAVLKFDHLQNKPTNILIFSLSLADGILGKWLFCFRKLLLSDVLRNPRG